MLALITCIVLSATEAVPPSMLTPLAAPQLPGGIKPPPPPPDPNKVAEEARKAAEAAKKATEEAAKKAAEEAKKAGNAAGQAGGNAANNAGTAAGNAAGSAAKGTREVANRVGRVIAGNAPPAVTPLPPPPPKDLRGGLGKNQCAMLVVSADLSGKGKDELKALYDFAEGAGAYLPGKTLADRYAEIAVLDKGNAKLPRFFDELDRMTQKYQAVDVVIHCHGDPFELLWDDVTFDVYDLACFADPALRSGLDQQHAVESGMLVALATQGNKLVGADGGGGGAMLATATEGKLWEKLRILDLNGGALQNGDPVQIVVSDGRFLCAENGGGGALRSNRDDAGAWETFTLGIHTTRGFGADAKVSFKTQSGAYLTVAGNEVNATGTQLGEAQKFTVRIYQRAQPKQALQVRTLSPQQRGRLRLVYETACFGASHAIGWRKLGFDFVAGARGVHTDSACSFPTFLGWWHNGCSFAECVDAANRADRNQSWDAWAKKQGFSCVDSQRLLRGNGAGNYTTPPVVQ